MILGAGWIAALTAIRRELRNYRPQPTPAEFAKARLLEVVEADRAALWSEQGRWVSRGGPVWIVPMYDGRSGDGIRKKAAVCRWERR